MALFPRSAALADDPLLAALLDELARRWHDGEPARVEELLDRHPELWDTPARAVRLVYEEVCLRRECGQMAAPEEWFARFPRWRAQLAVLFECHALLEADALGPRWPTVGETIAGYELLAALGAGSGGRVFLARQPALADRPVVVKATRLRGGEHLHLARLQHTHIVPLYAVADEADRELRLLCMPYFGGAPLDQVLLKLARLPLAQRTGASILAAAQTPDVRLAAAPALARLDYVQALCWIGVCLAEALHYAHEAGVVHLDLKPANVLIAADGQPLLLDFHLARPPLAAGAHVPLGIGGTPGYMPPEQEQAMTALAHGRPIPQALDRRADVYALGVVLAEALGATGAKAQHLAALRGQDPRVSVGLGDILGRCLQADPADRYSDAAGLADDLRRHLHDQPLRGVRNRSWAERLHKWRRRRPAALRTFSLVVTLFALAVTGLGSLALHVVHERQDAQRALMDGHLLWVEHADFTAARTHLEAALATARRLPWHADLVGAVRTELRQAEQAYAVHERRRLIRELHTLADRVRLSYGMEAGATARLAPVHATCQELWKQRRRLRTWLHEEPTRAIAEDLTDLALFSIESRDRAQVGRLTAHDTLAALDEIETLFGPSAVVAWQRQRHVPAKSSPCTPTTAWECFTLGRLALQAGDLPHAAEYLAEALRQQPHGLWPNYYHGLCAMRTGRPLEALTAFSVCIGAAPRTAGLYYNRGIAHAALEQPDLALRDYDRALELDTTLACAALNRGVLHYQAGRLSPAETDLRRALELGADPVTGNYNFALVLHAGRRDEPARAALGRVLALQPDHAGALALRDRLR